MNPITKDEAALALQILVKYLSQPQEMECPVCRGTGKHNQADDFGEIVVGTCALCKGEKKVTIEAAVRASVRAFDRFIRLNT